MKRLHPFRMIIAGLILLGILGLAAAVALACGLTRTPVPESFSAVVPYSVEYCIPPVKGRPGIYDATRLTLGRLLGKDEPLKDNCEYWACWCASEADVKTWGKDGKRVNGFTTRWGSSGKLCRRTIAGPF